MTAEKITFYTNKGCPYAQRAEIALLEVGAEFERVEIDLQNKPSWYKDINPETKVPALTSEGQNIAESLIIIEYISDLFPEKNLLPKEPLKRANVRFAIEYYSSKINSEFFKFRTSVSKDSFVAFEESVNTSLKRFNELLLQEAPTGPYFLGEQFSLADIAIAPFVQRTYAILREVTSSDYEFEQVKSNPRLAEFIQGIQSRPTIQKTFIGDKAFIEAVSKRFPLKKI